MKEEYKKPTCEFIEVNAGGQVASSHNDCDPDPRHPGWYWNDNDEWHRHDAAAAQSRAKEFPWSR